MGIAPAYIIQRFFFRLADFFHHWYVHGLRRIALICIDTLANFDKTFALKITLRYFFHPLYKDYTIVGRILGVVFRSGRVLIASALYAVVGLAFLIVAAVWVLIPPFLLIYAISSFIIGE